MSLWVGFVALWFSGLFYGVAIGIGLMEWVARKSAMEVD